ncbi:MAG TPA: hypothetical protein VMH86_13840 [Rhizomicrobium sp.]|nr:hypothetical protein [Rhizomicrobium sp.]
MAAGLVLAAGAARADGMGQLSGTLTGGYDRYDLNGTGQKPVNAFDAAGSAVLTLDNPGADIQINTGNTALKSNGNDTDLWSFGADAYWRDYAGEFGVNFTQNTFVTSTGHDFYSGGFFGEFYMLSDLTLRAKGGRVQGDQDGWYGDTGLVLYPLNQIAISLTGDYARFQHSGPRVTDGNLAIEYLPVRDVPVSLTIGYTYARFQDLTGGKSGNANIFSVALKAYFGGVRNGGLIDYQRNGATDWDGAPPTLVGTTF